MVLYSIIKPYNSFFVINIHIARQDFILNETAYWQYIEKMICNIPVDDDKTPTSPKFPKNLFSYIKSQKFESSNIATLRQNGQLHSDTKTKANILNERFQKAFTLATDDPIPNKGQSQYPLTFKFLTLYIRKYIFCKLCRCWCFVIVNLYITYHFFYVLPICCFIQYEILPCNMNIYHKKRIIWFYNTV
jgi:hypothetical protein